MAAAVGTVWSRWVVASVVAAVALGSAACDNEPSFAVGDCVVLEQQRFGHTLDAEDCSIARGTFEASERIYKVDEVVEGEGGTCGAPQGFFPIEFSHGPDGVTYCLSQAGS